MQQSAAPFPRLVTGVGADVRNPLRWILSDRCLISTLCSDIARIVGHPLTKWWHNHLLLVEYLQCGKIYRNRPRHPFRRALWHNAEQPRLSSSGARRVGKRSDSHPVSSYLYKEVIRIKFQEIVIIRIKPLLGKTNRSFQSYRTFKPTNTLQNVSPPTP